MPRLCAIKHVNLHQYLLKSRRNYIQANRNVTALAVCETANVSHCLLSVMIILLITGQCQPSTSAIPGFTGIITTRSPEG